MPVFKPFDDLYDIQQRLETFYRRCAELDGMNPHLWRHAIATYEAAHVLANLALPPGPLEGVQDTDDSAALGAEKGGF